MSPLATSIFDLRGPEFLTLYFFLAVAAVIVSAVLRWVLRGPGGDPSAADLRLPAFDVAYLHGGAAASVAAAVTSLVHRGLVDATNRKLGAPSPGSVSSRGLPPLELQVYNEIVRNHGLSGSRLRSRLRTLASPHALESLDLIVPAGRRALIRTATALPLLLVVCTGLLKISIGSSRDKPIAFLLFMTIFAGTGATLFAFARILRTRRGDAVLKEMRSRNSALRATASSNPQGLDAAELALACAIFGPVVFASSSGPYRDVAQTFSPASTASGSFTSGCGGSSCGGSSCGGGGGCGGCGGGG